MAAAEAAARKDAEPPLLTKRFLLNTALFVIVVVSATPFALKAIVPYWWEWFALAEGCALAFWGIVTWLAEPDVKKAARRMLDGPRSTWIVGSAMAACLLLCGALYVFLPHANAPYLRIFVLSDVLPALQNGARLRLTIEAPGQEAKNIPLQLDKAEAWFIGRPEDRVEWNETQHASDHQSIDSDTYDVLDFFGIPDEAKKVSTLTKPWKQAKTLKENLPENSKVTITLEQLDKNGRLVPYTPQVLYFAPGGQLPTQFEIKGTGPHDAFVGFPPP